MSLTMQSILREPHRDLDREIGDSSGEDHTTNSTSPRTRMPAHTNQSRRTNESNNVGWRSGIRRRLSFSTGTHPASTLQVGSLDVGYSADSDIGRGSIDAVKSIEVHNDHNNGQSNRNASIHHNYRPVSDHVGASVGYQLPKNMNKAYVANHLNRQAATESSFADAVDDSVQDYHSFVVTAKGGSPSRQGNGSCADGSTTNASYRDGFRNPGRSFSAIPRQDTQQLMETKETMISPTARSGLEMRNSSARVYRQMTHPERVFAGLRGLNIGLTLCSPDIFFTLDNSTESASHTEQVHYTAHDTMLVSMNEDKSRVRTTAHGEVAQKAAISQKEGQAAPPSLPVTHLKDVRRWNDRSIMESIIAAAKAIGTSIGSLSNSNVSGCSPFHSPMVSPRREICADSPYKGIPQDALKPSTTSVSSSPLKSANTGNKLSSEGGDVGEMVTRKVRTRVSMHMAVEMKFYGDRRWYPGVVKKRHGNGYALYDIALSAGHCEYEVERHMIRPAKSTDVHRSLSLPNDRYGNNVPAFTEASTDLAMYDRAYVRGDYVEVRVVHLCEDSPRDSPIKTNAGILMDKYVRPLNDLHACRLDDTPRCPTIIERNPTRCEPRQVALPAPVSSPASSHTLTTASGKILTNENVTMNVNMNARTVGKMQKTVAWRRGRVLFYNTSEGTYSVRMQNGSDIAGVYGRDMRACFRLNDEVDCREKGSPTWMQGRVAKIEGPGCYSVLFFSDSGIRTGIPARRMMLAFREDVRIIAADEMVHTGSNQSCMIQKPHNQIDNMAAIGLSGDSQSPAHLSTYPKTHGKEPVVNDRIDVRVGEHMQAARILWHSIHTNMYVVKYLEGSLEGVVHTEVPSEYIHSSGAPISPNSKKNLKPYPNLSPLEVMSFQNVKNMQRKKSPAGVTQHVGLQIHTGNVHDTISKLSSSEIHDSRDASMQFHRPIGHHLAFGTYTGNLQGYTDHHHHHHYHGATTGDDHGYNVDDIVLVKFVGSVAHEEGRVIRDHGDGTYTVQSTAQRGRERVSESMLSKMVAPSSQYADSGSVPHVNGISPDTQDICANTIADKCLDNARESVPLKPSPPTHSKPSSALHMRRTERTVDIIEGNKEEIKSVPLSTSGIREQGDEFQGNNDGVIATTTSCQTLANFLSATKKINAIKSTDTEFVGASVAALHGLHDEEALQNADSLLNVCADTKDPDDAARSSMPKRLMSIEDSDDEGACDGFKLRRAGYQASQASPNMDIDSPRRPSNSRVATYMAKEVEDHMANTGAVRRVKTDAGSAGAFRSNLIKAFHHTEHAQRTHLIQQHEHAESFESNERLASGSVCLHSNVLFRAVYYPKVSRKMLVPIVVDAKLNDNFNIRNTCDDTSRGMHGAHENADQHRRGDSAREPLQYSEACGWETGTDITVVIDSPYVHFDSGHAVNVMFWKGGERSQSLSFFGMLKEEAFLSADKDVDFVVQVHFYVKAMLVSVVSMQFTYSHSLDIIPANQQIQSQMEGGLRRSMNQIFRSVYMVVPTYSTRQIKTNGSAGYSSSSPSKAAFSDAAYLVPSMQILKSARGMSPSPLIRKADYVQFLYMEVRGKHVDFGMKSHNSHTHAGTYGARDGVYGDDFATNEDVSHLQNGYASNNNDSQETHATHQPASSMMICTYTDDDVSNALAAMPTYLALQNKAAVTIPKWLPTRTQAHAESHPESRTDIHRDIHTDMRKNMNTIIHGNEFQDASFPETNVAACPTIDIYNWIYGADVDEVLKGMRRRLYDVSLAFTCMFTAPVHKLVMRASEKEALHTCGHTCGDTQAHTHLPFGMLYVPVMCGPIGACLSEEGHQLITASLDHADDLHPEFIADFDGVFSPQSDSNAQPSNRKNTHPLTGAQAVERTHTHTHIHSHAQTHTQTHAQAQTQAEKLSSSHGGSDRRWKLLCLADVFSASGGDRMEDERSPNPSCNPQGLSSRFIEAYETAALDYDFVYEAYPMLKATVAVLMYTCLARNTQACTCTSRVRMSRPPNPMNVELPSPFKTISEADVGGLKSLLFLADLYDEIYKVALQRRSVSKRWGGIEYVSRWRQINDLETLAANLSEKGDDSPCVSAAKHPSNKATSDQAQGMRREYDERLTDIVVRYCEDALMECRKQDVHTCMEIVTARLGNDTLYTCTDIWNRSVSQVTVAGHTYWIYDEDDAAIEPTWPALMQLLGRLHVSNDSDDSGRTYIQAD